MKTKGNERDKTGRRPRESRTATSVGAYDLTDSRNDFFHDERNNYERAIRSARLAYRTHFCFPFNSSKQGIVGIRPLFMKHGHP